MYTKKQMIIYSLVALLALLLILYFFGVIKKTCSDEECFKEKINSCSPIKYDRQIKNNIYTYEISRSLGNNCKIKISLERSSEGTLIDEKIKLEGKTMKCSIPKEELISLNIDEVENLLQYCTGPLKEGIYEIIIRNMYGVIISNLGEVLSEVQTSVIKKI
jgi:hypothetical protein